MFFIGINLIITDPRFKALIRTTDKESVAVSVKIVCYISCIFLFKNLIRWLV